MSKATICIVDDQPSQQQMLEWDLRDLFGSAYDFRCLPIYEDVQEYLRDLDDPTVIGVLVDQKLNESGSATSYTGIDLAKRVRTAFPEIPLFLVTGYDPDDQIKSAEAGVVEAVIHKSELRADTPASTRFRERFLRQAKRYEDSLDEWQRRFRELIKLSVNGTISTDERAELAALETERLMPTLAAEANQVSKVDKQIEALEAAERLLEKIAKEGRK